MEITKEIKEIAASNPVPLMLETLSHLVPLNRELKFIKIVMDHEYVSIAEDFEREQYTDGRFFSTMENLEENYPNFEHPEFLNLIDIALNGIKKHCGNNDLLYFFCTCCMIYIFYKDKRFIHLGTKDTDKVSLNNKYWKEVIEPYFDNLKEQLEEQALENKSKHRILSSFTTINQYIKPKIKVFKWRKSIKVLLTLFNELVDKNLINKDTPYSHFKAFFPKVDKLIESKERIDWEGSNRLLAYLVDGLAYDGYIVGLEPWACAKNVFTKSENLINDKAEYLKNKNGKPKGSNIVDSIFSKLENNIAQNY